MLVVHKCADENNHKQPCLEEAEVVVVCLTRFKALKVEGEVVVAESDELLDLGLPVGRGGRRLGQ